MTTHWIRYVPHHMVKLYEDYGWEIACAEDARDKPSSWSVLMKHTKEPNNLPHEPLDNGK